MTDIQAAAIANETGSLDELNLSKADLSGAGAFEGLLDIITQRPCLRKLDLSSTRFSGKEDFSKLLSTLQAIDTLQELTLAHYLCGNYELDGPSIGTFLKSNKTLQKLDLSGHLMGPKAANDLCSGLQNNPSLTTLRLHNCALDEESTALVLATGVNLSVLDISANGLFPPSFLNTSVTTFLNENKNLESLVLDYSRSMFAVDDIDSLRPFLQALEINTTLKSLSLRHCDIRDDIGKAILQTLTVNETLNKLNLEYSRFGLRDQGKEILIEMLPKLKALQELRIITRFNPTLSEKMLNAVKKSTLQVCTARMSDGNNQERAQRLLDRNLRLSQAQTLLGAVHVPCSLLPAATSCLCRTSAGSAATYQILQQQIVQCL